VRPSAHCLGKPCDQARIRSPTFASALRGGCRPRVGWTPLGNLDRAGVGELNICPSKIYFVSKVTVFRYYHLNPFSRLEILKFKNSCAYNSKIHAPLDQTAISETLSIVDKASPQGCCNMQQPHHPREFGTVRFIGY